MISLRFPVAIWLGAILFAPGAPAQVVPREPHIGYMVPAGGRRGTTVEATIGGQYLDGVSEAIISGENVKATVVKHTKPLTQKQINDLRQKFQPVEKRLQAQRKSGGAVDSFEKAARDLGASPDELKTYADIRNPKRQPNPQIAETVTLKIDFDSGALPGERELRLVTKAGLTKPVRFRVGQFTEYHEREPNDLTAGDEGAVPPFVLNGQILPGDIDRFSFRASKGMRLVLAASAQALTPYLADAVPGWFQATLALYDGEGREVAYADDYRFHPDPVVLYEAPADGEYVLEIQDAIFRGREDFVYRITVGEVPFVTSIFPLGGRRGGRTTVEIEGWNLPVDRLVVGTLDKPPGVYPISVAREEQTSNQVPFAVGKLPECLEREPNDSLAGAQRLMPPLVVNGRIDAPGDWDVFSFQCRARGQIFAEVRARRLDSPLDSVLRLTDASGRQLTINDDHVDQGAGLLTHHADSRIRFTIPEDGLYYLHLGDTQRKGGRDYAYRLGIDAQSPSFRLHVAPPSINARAGSNVPIHVFALRQDGFSDDIRLELKNPPQGFGISGAWVPAGQDDVWLTLAVPPVALEKPVGLRLEGRAMVDGEMIRQVAVPSEDMMQAFINRHLVPAQDWMISVTGSPRFKIPAKQTSAGRGQTAAKPVPRALQAVPLEPPSPARPLKLPVGSTAVAEIPAPPAVIDDLENIVLTLSDPPEGVTIEGLSALAGGVAVRVRCEAGKAEPGRKGNLIVEAASETTTGDGVNGPVQKRRSPLGLLPAIPFEIVAPALGTRSN